MSDKFNFGEGVGDIIIAILLSHRSSYRFNRILKERRLRHYKEGTVRVNLSRLKKNGYLSNPSSGQWILTQKGKLYTKEKFLYHYIPSPFTKDSKIGTIISFDIPGPQRIKRDWLRNQIKIFGYKMLQQSLWLGPGPLPKEFLKRLGDLKIKENVKIFSVTNTNS